MEKSEISSLNLTLNQVKKLYDYDYNFWIEAIKKKIKEKDYENMDWDNLIEEIDDMGKSQRRSLESYLERLIAHVLKLRYWTAEKENNSKHWKVEIINFRRRIKRLLKQNPSFNSLLVEIYPEIFQDVVDAWKIEFDIPDAIYIALEEILEENQF